MASKRDDEQGAQPRPEDEPGPPPGDYLAPEVSRRVSSILDVVEREAAELRQQARDEARRYFGYSKRRADGLVAERQRRIATLSDALVGRAERVLAHLEGAEPVRAALDDLVRALGETAERLARETGDYSEFEPPPFSETPPAPPRTAPEPLPLSEPQGPYEPPRPRTVQPPPTAAGQPAVSTPRPAAPESPRPAGPEPQPPGLAPRSPFSLEPSVAPPPDDAGLADQHWQNLNGAQMVAIQMAAAGSTRAQVEAHVRKSLGVAHPEPILDEVFGPGSHDDARVPWARPTAE